MAPPASAPLPREEAVAALRRQRRGGAGRGRAAPEGRGEGAVGGARGRASYYLVVRPEVIGLQGPFCTSQRAQFSEPNAERNLDINRYK